jgi:hypothetical protein
MRAAQDYWDKAAQMEELANDPHQPEELRTELRAIARQWRHRAEVTDWFTRTATGEEPVRLGAARLWRVFFR